LLKALYEQSHIDNFGTLGLKKDMLNGIENLSEMLQGWTETDLGKFSIIDGLDFLANRDDL
jgi:hypothetical protein